MTTSHFIFSTVSIGLANTVVDWLIIGSLFHQYQRLTPQTWRKENYSSYTYSTILSFVFGALFTLFYVKIGSHYVLPANTLSNCKLGLICFGCFTLITELGNAIYVNYNKAFVVGKLIAAAINFTVAALIAGYFYW